MSSLGQSLRKKVAKLIIAGVGQAHICEETTKIVSDLEVGGLILFRRNIQNPLQTFLLIKELRKLRQSPILLCVDQEGGRVQRLKAPLTQFPPMRQFGQTQDMALITDLGVQLGSEIKAVGFDLTFAPVVDVDTNPKNPVIGDRAFSSDPKIVADCAQAFILGLHQSHILSCAKHFPGHGDTLHDSHLDLPTLEHGLERLRRIEWTPFRAAIDAGVKSIMSAHVMFPQIDKKYPATLSLDVMNILRHELHFKNTIISDDLEMKSISDRYQVPIAAKLAIIAGCDMLLICHTFTEIEKSIDVITHAILTQEISQNRFNEAFNNATQLLDHVKPLPNDSYKPAPAPSLRLQKFLQEHSLIAKNAKFDLKDPTEV